MGKKLLCIKSGGKAPFFPVEGQNHPSMLSAPQQQSDGYLYIAGIIMYLWIVNTENYSRVNAIRFTDKLEASINLDYNRN